LRAPAFWTQPGLIPTLLRPLGLLWAGAGAWRQARTRPWRAPVPVICIGNLIMGGAGKTPVAMALAQRLQGHGHHPHLLSRGYGGKLKGPLRVDPSHHTAQEVGDEPLLLAKAAPCWIAHDRKAGILAAAAAGADLIILDDGFQNPGVAKDFSFIVIDHGYGFGNGEVFPAGPLREPAARGLARADAVILLGEGAELPLPPELPRLEARFAVTAAPPLGGKRVLAFAGIGRPAKFYATLADQGALIAATRDFADHHPYRPEEVASLIEEASKAEALPVTTEKDWVRLPEALRDRVAKVEIAVEWADEAALDRLLLSLESNPRN